MTEVEVRNIRRFMYGFAVLLSLWLMVEAANNARWFQVGGHDLITTSALHWVMIYSAIPSFWLGVLFESVVGMIRSRKGRCHDAN